MKGTAETLAVTDFGPIAEARVDLRPLTVFVGPSNTGKSYLAILLYALHLCLGRGSRSPWRRPWRPDRWIRTEELPSSVREHLKDWILAGPEAAMPADVTKHLRSVLERAEGLEQRVEAELSRCFGVEQVRELARAQSAGARVDLRLPTTVEGEGARYGFELGHDGLSLAGHLAEPLPIASELHEQARTRLEDELRFSGLLNDAARDEKDLEQELQAQELQRMFGALTERTFAALVETVSNPYYLPADRTGVMHSHQVVVNTLIQNATMAGLRPSTGVPMLSGVLGDFLSQLIDMSTRSRDGRTKRSDLAARLEEHILQGVVRIDRPATGYPSFTYRPRGWKADLPLMRASSMVSELAPVVLYLRHLVRPGDLLIIEEPEAQLHPGMQAALARELACLVQSGVRIVLTTHSEWILEQFGNLVGRSALPEAARAGLADPDCALQPEQVGAWFFDPSGKPPGARVREIELDPETGLYPTDHDDVSEALYNESAAIFNRLQDGAVE